MSASSLSCGSIPPRALEPQPILSVGPTGSSAPREPASLIADADEMPMRRSELPTLPDDWSAAEHATKPMF